MNPEAMTETVTLQERLDEVDSTISEYKEQIALGEAIQRLEANPDYQLVISQTYLGKEADRITDLIVGDDFLKREQMENIVEMGLSIRNFKQFIKYKKIDAQNAPNYIADLLRFRSQVTEEFANSPIDADVIE